MTIQHRYDGIVEGNYGTQVEIYEGSAGNYAMDLYGKFQDRMISFVVHYPKSVAIYVGQCYEVDNEDILKMTWTLHSKVDDIQNDWMSKRFGFNTFKPKQY
uniref:Uncharacterized protein n=1 Tax=Acrobeloides nanus TaxID=290746 RepID=A0A914C1S6_9BILA